MKRFILISALFLSYFSSLFAQQNEPIAKIETSLGIIKIKLYNETPKHRDNFIKLVKDKTYQDLLFHRVINGFMIQGGDPKSKNATPDTQLGNGGLGYTIAAEINPKFIHKKGALAAARKGDNVNPKQESSSCQFYIVQGKTYKENDLHNMELRINRTAKAKIANQFLYLPENEKYKIRYTEAQKNKNKEALDSLTKEVEPLLKKAMDKHIDFKYTPAQIKEYTTVGGTPHLDGAYTVFGEVIEGMNIVDKIAAVSTKAGDRPAKDVRFTITME